MCAGCWVDYRWALDVECLLLLYKKFVTDQTLICKKTIHKDGNMVWWNFEAQLDMTSTYMGGRLDCGCWGTMWIGRVWHQGCLGGHGKLMVYKFKISTV